MVPLTLILTHPHFDVFYTLFRSLHSLLPHFLGHLIFLLLMMVFSVVLLISEFLEEAVVSLGTSYSDALVSVAYVDIFVSNSTPCNS